MSNPIGGLNPAVLQQLNRLTANGIDTSDVMANQPSNGDTQFKDLIMQSIGQVNDMQQNADMAIETLMTGGDVNPAEVLTAIQKADMSFRMMQQIRNKLVDAYNELKEIRI